MAQVEIEYCTGCKWMMRAAWTAQEILTTFDTQIESVTLRPSSQGGVFAVRINGNIVHDRKQDEGFLELKVLKQRIRDRISPSTSLGHSDGTS